MSVERLLWESDAVGLAAAVRKGDVSPAELVDAAIARCERTNPEINAVAEQLYDRARGQAKTADRERPLAGVPFALKDLGIAISGVPLHTGSRVPALVPDFDSVLAERYLAAGLIPIATSTAPEHGLRLMTESAAFGITRNPWDLSRTSGGSSGGAAALVAAGVVPAAHASDGGGSIRVPAACCGLIGLKPSRGRVPLTPLASEAWYGLIVDHVVTRSVRDTALLLDLTHGADALSPYEAKAPSGTFASAAAGDPGRLALAVWRKSPLALDISDETQAALDAAVALAREAGHTVDEIDIAVADRDFIADFAKLVAAAVAGAMRLEARRLGRGVVSDLERSTRVIARFGEVLSGGEVYAARQSLDTRARRIIADTARFDAVLMPVLAHPPLPCGAMVPKGADDVTESLLDKLRLTRLLKLKPLLGQLMDKSLWFTHWTPIQNVTGQPSIALPVHMTAQGLPLGIQAVGRPGGEETLLSLAGQFEKIGAWGARRAPFQLPA